MAALGATLLKDLSDQAWEPVSELIAIFTCWAQWGAGNVTARTPYLPPFTSTFTGQPPSASKHAISAFAYPFEKAHTGFKASP